MTDRDKNGESEAESERVTQKGRQSKHSNDFTCYVELEMLTTTADSKMGHLGKLIQGWQAD